MSIRAMIAALGGVLSNRTDVVTFNIPNGNIMGDYRIKEMSILEEKVFSMKGEKLNSNHQVCWEIRQNQYVVIKIGNDKGRYIRTDVGNDEICVLINDVPYTSQNENHKKLLNEFNNEIKELLATIDLSAFPWDNAHELVDLLRSIS